MVASEVIETNVMNGISGTDENGFYGTNGTNETNGTKAKDEKLSPKQKRAFVKMLSKFIRFVKFDAF